MELTAAASWLNTAFAGYDRLILSALHAVSNSLFTFLFKLITLLGEKGILFFLAAIIFMLFPKTRKLGVCIFGAVCCGALITNIILKDLVARPRPLTVAPYSQWWAEIGAPMEDDWSFPSGHVTAAAAGMVAIRLMKGKKWTVPAIVWILLMMISRNYLMAHYPSDVLAAAIIGTASAFIAYFITRFIFQFLYINRRKNWCGLVLNWSAPDYKGIPSRLGLTGEPENDYFTKVFGEGAAESEPSDRKSTPGAFGTAVKSAGTKVKEFASTVLKKTPASSDAAAENSSAEETVDASAAVAVPAESVQQEHQPVESAAVSAADGEPATEKMPETENRDAAAPESVPEPSRTEGSHAAAAQKKSGFSLNRLGGRSSSRSGYQGKHVK